MIRRERALAALALAVAFACETTVDVGHDQAGLDAGAGPLPSGGAPGAGGEPAGGEGGAAAECQPAECLGTTYACGDCQDNDTDGLTDADDPECVGACDNTEDSFFGGIPGQNNAPCRQDCYFDQDSGAGNDACAWSHACDPLSQAPDYPPSGDDRCEYDPDTTVANNGDCAELDQNQDPSCLDFCLPITPNGCDCFGCCELPAGSASYVWLGSSDQNQGTCTLDALDDPAACHPCTPVSSCFNPCDACEVCAGGEPPAQACDPSERCPQDRSACGVAGDAPCRPDEYCVTGCCRPVPR